MNLNHLYYFQILANMRHFSNAAAQCYITQSNLSYAIKSLEEELGVQLIDRKNRSVALTEAGKIFLDHVDKALNELEAAKKILAPTADGGDARIVVGSRRINYVSFMIEQFQLSEEYKNINIEVHQRTSEDIVKELLSGDLDVGFCTSKTDHTNIIFYPIRDQDLVLIVPANHPLAEYDKIDLASTKNYPYVAKTGDTPSSRNTKELFKKAGFQPKVSGTVDAYFNVAFMVEKNIGISIVPNLMNLEKYNVKAIQIVNPVQVNYMYLCYLKNQELPHHLKQFCEYVKLYFGEI